MLEVSDFHPCYDEFLFDFRFYLQNLHLIQVKIVKKWLR